MVELDAKDIKERRLRDEKDHSILQQDVEGKKGWETLSEAGVRTYWKKNERTGSWEKVKKEAKIVRGKT
jgi:hypothetical protein